MSIIKIWTLWNWGQGLLGHMKSTCGPLLIPEPVACSFCWYGRFMKLGLFKVANKERQTHTTRPVNRPVQWSNPALMTKSKCWGPWSWLQTCFEQSTRNCWIYSEWIQCSFNFLLSSNEKLAANLLIRQHTFPHTSALQAHVAYKGM